MGLFSRRINDAVEKAAAAGAAYGRSSEAAAIVHYILGSAQKCDAAGGCERQMQANLLRWLAGQIALGDHRPSPSTKAETHE